MFFQTEIEYREYKGKDFCYTWFLGIRYVATIIIITMKTMTLSMGLLLISILALSCISTSIFKQQNQALAQPYIQTINQKFMDLQLQQLIR